MSGKEKVAQTRDSIAEMVERLRRERDELAVKLNLSKMEIRDEWESLEKRWNHLETHLTHFGEEAKASSSKVGREIADAYRRLRNTLN